MQVTTTHYGPKKVKGFSWSYSKLKNYESCPKRHWHIDIQKDVKEEESEELKLGNMLHKALADRLSKGKPLPVAFAKYEPWAVKAIGDGRGTMLVEQKFAIDRDLNPCSFFDDSAWYRGIADAVKIVGPVALAIDWKTGKIVEDSVQLALMAQCVFAHHPTIKHIRTEFVWLKVNATTRADFSRQDMTTVWAGLLPRVMSMKEAHDTMSYPPKPSALCRRWCPVTQCPHHGE